jgi:hypothetical protein
LAFLFLRYTCCLRGIHATQEIFFQKNFPAGFIAEMGPMDLSRVDRGYRSRYLFCRPRLAESHPDINADSRHPR